MDSKFFCNSECEYFPCHEGVDEDDFNCLFCYCPLYNFSDCGGNFSIIEERGIKDCSKCTLPHEKKSYVYIISKLDEATH